jgi:PDDEXK-like domain of unknown function (DUF3799)
LSNLKGLTKPKLKPLVDGLNDVSNEEYHADREYISSSVLKKIYKSLDEYHMEYISGIKCPVSNSTQSAFDEGSLAHSYILEPDKVMSDFSFFKGFRKAGQEFEDFLAQAGSDKPIISSTQHHRVKELIEAYNKRPTAVELIKGGFAEQTICGELQGVKVKTRFDYINPDKGYIADVKTTGYPSEIESFKITMDGLSYHLSAALYCAMAEQFYGKPFDFYFIVLSKRDKTCDVYKVSKQTMLMGKRIIAEALAKYKKAKETNVWTELTENDKVKLEPEYEIKEV